VGIRTGQSISERQIRLTEIEQERLGHCKRRGRGAQGVLEDVNRLPLQSVWENSEPAELRAAHLLDLALGEEHAGEIVDRCDALCVLLHDLAQKRFGLRRLAARDREQRCVELLRGGQCRRRA
jgi:hypothetical protein